MIIRVLFGVALLGTLTSTIFLALVIVAAVRFKRKARSTANSLQSASLPPVSLLKPLHGAEPGLREYLESFFAQDYPQFEILFCARADADPGLQLAREVAALHPERPVRFLLSGQPPWPNARCYSLSVMAPQAAHDILVITDSDVRVRPDFLRRVIAPFASSEVGAATCVYRGDATGRGFWALMEGLGMSVEMTAGVIVADMLEGMRFTLGPCMIVRKGVLASFGGFDKLGYYYADDFMLGNMVAATGKTVVLSSHIIDHAQHFAPMELDEIDPVQPSLGASRHGTHLRRALRDPGAAFCKPDAYAVGRRRPARLGARFANAVVPLRRWLGHWRPGGIPLLLALSSA